MSGSSPSRCLPPSVSGPPHRWPKELQRRQRWRRRLPAIDIMTMTTTAATQGHLDFGGSVDVAGDVADVVFTAVSPVVSVA